MTVVLSACGGSGDGESKSSAGGQGPLSKAQLTDALPEGADLPGFTAEPQSLPLLETKDVVTTGQAACRPIVDMMSVRPRLPRQAMVWATIEADGAPASAPPGSVTLTSHDGDTAAQWMTALKRAVADCTRFTATSKRGWTYDFTVASVPLKRMGDDVVGYRISNVLDPSGGGNVMSVVRTGTTLATYLLTPSENGKPRPVPESVAIAQEKRIRAAAD
ncbi:hypothetical protein [Streptomyces phaeochromogenes]|uniref:hypothetical protein n=1 Tax=Streptomyces phaeochromogenes TaxID=1923 RepID=UPI00225A5624|nr:hypothetical protein [Streptomyces phaeochromogenes]